VAERYSSFAPETLIAHRFEYPGIVVMTQPILIVDVAIVLLEFFGGVLQEIEGPYIRVGVSIMIRIVDNGGNQSPGRIILLNSLKIETIVCTGICSSVLVEMQLSNALSLKLVLVASNGAK